MSRTELIDRYNAECWAFQEKWKPFVHGEYLRFQWDRDFVKLTAGAALFGIDFALAVQEGCRSKEPENSTPLACQATVDIESVYAACWDTMKTAP